MIVFTTQKTTDGCLKFWTEKELGILRSKDATRRADEYRKIHYDIDYESYRKQKDVEKTRRFYESHIKDDKVVVPCEYCKEDHTVMRISYEENIKNNGRFICNHENGHI